MVSNFHMTPFLPSPAGKYTKQMYVLYRIIDDIYDFAFDGIDSGGRFAFEKSDQRSQMSGTALLLADPCMFSGGKFKGAAATMKYLVSAILTFDMKINQDAPWENHLVAQITWMFLCMGQVSCATKKKNSDDWFGGFMASGISGYGGFDLASLYTSMYGGLAEAKKPFMPEKKKPIPPWPIIIYGGLSAATSIWGSMMGGGLFSGGIFGDEEEIDSFSYTWFEWKTDYYRFDPNEFLTDEEARIAYQQQSGMRLF